jgi:hypothetical protein
MPRKRKPDIMGTFVQLNIHSRQAASSPIGYIVTNGCWEWVGALRGGGYGHWNRNPTGEGQAHRAVYVMTHGPIPKGMTLDHLCRNRICVNPDHLEIVTHRENILRSNGLAAKNLSKTECPLGHPYSGDNLVICRNGRRRCRICRVAETAKRKAARHTARREREAASFMAFHRSRKVCR